MSTYCAQTTALSSRMNIKTDVVHFRSLNHLPSIRRNYIVTVAEIKYCGSPSRERVLAGVQKRCDRNVFRSFDLKLSEARPGMGRESPS